MNTEIKRQLNNFFANYFGVLVLIVVIVILYGGYAFVLAPKIQASRDEAGKVSSEREQTYLLLKSDLAKLEELTMVFNSIETKNNEKMEKILPRKIELEELIKQMEVIIIQNGLFLTSVIVAEGPQLNKDIGTANISIDVVGTSYSGFKSLLRTLENNLRLLDITSVSFVPESKTTHLEIVTYYQL